MTRLDDSVRRFWSFCQKRHLPQAVLQGIPYIGPSIRTIIYDDGTVEDLIKQVECQNTQQQQEILSRLEAIIEQMVGPPGYILVVGSGNGERVLQFDGVLQLGRKYMSSCHEFLGGSGVNYTLRLINAGFPVFPIVSIGKDRLGHIIREEILVSARKNNLSRQALEFVDSEDFFVANIRTVLSTILVEKTQRTIFTEQIHGAEHFKDYTQNRLTSLDTQPGANIKAVAVGHILADNPALNPSHPGECSRYIIQSFCDRCFVFANFGNSQIRMGAEFWEEDLKKLSVFQLNLAEMREFFARNTSTKPLVNIIKWLQERNITAVITLDKFGAVGTYKDGRDGVVLAWPFEFEGIVDSTGAGDAFGAGLVSKLYQKADFSFTEFFTAIGEARVWAAYACTALGGATNCPNRRQLKEFRKELLAAQPDPVEVERLGHAERILRILDRAQY